MLVTSGLVSYRKAAAATTSVVQIQIPHAPRGGFPYNEDTAISIIEVFYAVTTAALTSAPTVVLNKQTYPGGTGTGFAATSTIAQSLTFAGVDAVGTAAGAGAAGSHIAVVTVSTLAAALDTESTILTITMNEAATSVLDIFGITVTYACG